MKQKVYPKYIHFWAKEPNKPAILGGFIRCDNKIEYNEYKKYFEDKKIIHSVSEPITKNIADKIKEN